MMRRAYTVKPKVCCPKCGNPVRTIRQDRYGVCHKCKDLFEIPEAAAQIEAEAELHSCIFDGMHYRCASCGGISADNNGWCSRCGISWRSMQYDPGIDLNTIPDYGEYVCKEDKDVR